MEIMPDSGVLGWRFKRCAHAGELSSMGEGDHDSNLKCVSWVHAGKSIAHGGCWPVAFHQTTRQCGQRGKTWPDMF
jgi:hypothetical protein